MNILKYVKVTCVLCGISKNSGSRFCKLSGVELASKDSENDTTHELGRPVYDDFLSKQILEKWDDEKLFDLVKNKSTVAVEVANFKDKENPDKWVTVPVGLSLVGDFDI